MGKNFIESNFRRKSMKRKKILTVLCSVVLGVSMIFGGCGSSKSSETTSKQSSDSTSEETTIYGQISSIDGNTITIALAEEPQMPEGATEMPEGSTESGKAGKDDKQMGGMGISLTG